MPLSYLEAAAESDEALVARCRQELPYNTTVFEELMARYRTLVLGICRRDLGNREEAEEACQDVFLRVFHQIHGFQGRSSFKTWLLRIAINVCATRRARAARRTQWESEEEATAERAPASPGPRAGRSLAGRALEQLAGDDRRIILLRYVSELSLEEIAATLDINLSAAKMRLYRAVERFQSAYRSESEL